MNVNNADIRYFISLLIALIVWIFTTFVKELEEVKDTQKVETKQIIIIPCETKK